MRQFIMLTNLIPEQVVSQLDLSLLYKKLSLMIHYDPPCLTCGLSASRVWRVGWERGDNRDKSKFILEAVTLNDIFTDFFNSSFDNVLSALFIFLKDESWLKISSAH